MSSISSEVYTDISVIISMMPIEMKSKISNSFIEFIENNKSNNYISNINPKIPIKEQNIRKETKEMLGLIYRDYLCSSEQRKILIKEEQKEIMEYEEELRQKYNPNDVFGKRQIDLKNQNIENKEKYNENLPINVKETFLKKVIRFFKSIFYR